MSNALSLKVRQVLTPYCPYEQDIILNFQQSSFHGVKLTETGLNLRKSCMIFTVVETLLKCNLFRNLRDDGRLLTGRKFLRTKSRPGFFSRGIQAQFSKLLSETRPVTRDILTISVIEGANTSRQDFNTHVGTGSGSQYALVDSQIIFNR